MRRFISLLLMFIIVSSPSTAYTEEEYDPQHTMLALNMAIVSIHRIVSTQDRIVLDQEYNNIINNLSLGNIESDYEMTGLYEEMMSFIKGRALRQEEAQRFRERYERREQKQLIASLSGIRAYGGNIWSWLASLLTSCVSSYFDYQNAKAELLEGLDDELWQLKKEDIDECNELQTKLLNSSWNLLRRYKLPDSYRLVQKNMDDFYRAVNESDPPKRMRMFAALEKDFTVYPPYWFYRGQTAYMINDSSEAERCFGKFDEVFRPVLRQDPYRVEIAKYRIIWLMNRNMKNETLSQLEIMRANTPRDNWIGNIFAGIAYYGLGEKKKAENCVQLNVDFNYGADVSAIILDMMKKENGTLKLEDMPELIESAIETATIQGLLENVKDKETALALSEYFKGNEAEAMSSFDRLSGNTDNPVVFFALWLMERFSTPSLAVQPKLNELNERQKKVYKPEFFTELLPLVKHYNEQNSENALIFSAFMYDLGWGLERDDKKVSEYLEKVANVKDYAEKKFYFFTEWFRGQIYYYIAKDYAKAREHLQNSAQKGYAYAQDLLGDIYYRGYLGERDYDSALEWYMKAAVQGHIYGAYDVGDCYFQGRGTVKMIWKAYVWFRVAELLGGEFNNLKSALKKIRGSKGLIWDDDPMLSPSYMNTAENEAQKTYREIQARWEKELRQKSKPENKQDNNTKKKSSWFWW